MGMLSYKQYKLLHENFDSVIGISRPTNIGIQTEAPQLVGMMAKKMHGGVPHKPGFDADMDDAEGDEDIDDAEGDMGDEEGDMDDAEGDMGDEEGDMDDAEGDEDMGDAKGDEDMGMGGPMAGTMGVGAGMGMGGAMGKKKPMPPPPQMMKKMGAMYMKKETADPQDAKMKAQNKKNKASDQKDTASGTAQKKTTCVREDAACCSKCGKMKKRCCKMTKEQKEFNDSLMRQAGALKFEKDELGFWVPVKEDVLIQPNTDVTSNDEPQAGEIGFAPQQKIGVLGSNFQEWASRHR